MQDLTFSQLERIQGGVGEVDAALQMDQESFRSLYERTSRPLWVFLWRKTGDSQLADDLLQETYYRFLRVRSEFESENHRRNYLYRIATNLVHDSRRNRVEAGAVALENNHPPPIGMDDAAQTVRRADLSRAMAQLQPRQRDALWLAYAEGSSHEEIAAVLGVKTASVKLLLFRARRKLANLLRGES